MPLGRNPFLLTERWAGTAMNWVALSVLSALFLGVYGLAKKKAVHRNAVAPVLFLNVLTAALVYAPVVGLSLVRPDEMRDSIVFVAPLPLLAHGLLFAKVVLVGTSWILAFHALKNLPLSIAAPIRSTSPLWTILIAITLLSERPSIVQWCGILTILAAFVAFSRVGRAEGICFRTNRFSIMMIAATLLGSGTALYDKCLLQRWLIPPVTLQAWFSIYLVMVILPGAINWYIRRRKTELFQFRWSIIAIAISLLIADLLYFVAISEPESLISVISPIRRTSVILPFLYGVVCLAEKQWKPKAACIGAMLVGVFLISSGRT